MSSHGPIGFAILGAGVVAEYYHQAIQANEDVGARLIAIGHYNPDRFDEISDQYGVPCVTFDDLLGDGAIKVICIATPSGQHASQAIKAAEAGKHVIVEKPIALNLTDADRMIAVCERMRVKLAVCLQNRSQPPFNLVRQAIAAGDLGELTLGLVTLPFQRSQAYYDQAAWRGTWALDGGGILMNQGIHHIDLLVWYMGDPVEVRAGAGTLHRDIEVEDVASASIEFANGAQAAVLGTTTACPGFPARLEIYGTRGGIQIEGEDVRRWDLADPGSTTVDAPPIVAGVTDAVEARDPRGTSPLGHIAVVRDFISAVREDRRPLVDGREGRRSLAAVLGIYKAAGIIDSPSGM